MNAFNALLHQLTSDLISRTCDHFSGPLATIGLDSVNILDKMAALVISEGIIVPHTTLTLTTLSIPECQFLRLRRPAPRASPSPPNSRVKHSRALHRRAPARERESARGVPVGEAIGAHCDLYSEFQTRPHPTARPTPNSTLRQNQLEGLAQCAREMRLAERTSGCACESGGCHSSPVCQADRRARLTFAKLDLFDWSLLRVTYITKGGF